MHESAERALWFQYRSDVVSDFHRVTHCAAAPGFQGEIQSWCGQEFSASDVERAAGPGEAAGPDKAPPAAPCTACLMKLTAAINTTTEPVPSTPAGGTSDDRELAVVLRKAQWLLDDTAHHLLAGRCGPEEREALATTLEQLAALVRDRPPPHLDPEPRRLRAQRRLPEGRVE
ncbi:hypothetical protein [Saccharopolyspora mangrovi]|uniref:Uncharacterized protein n=1 Tax=Saccharopolyspora mangrovi TaxID=3082379 RepID=A0ABU6AEI2_9PSEU|nr:hypothetical protein [Saccharopolyspora sp. S2-29]MEB3369872.1 hypothetical protein [Saccharopolyspora sp. S2-29]